MEGFEEETTQVQGAILVLDVDRKRKRCVDACSAYLELLMGKAS